MNSRKINRSKYKDHSSSIYKFNIEELGGSSPQVVSGALADRRISFAWSSSINSVADYENKKAHVGHVF